MRRAAILKLRKLLLLASSVLMLGAMLGLAQSTSNPPSVPAAGAEDIIPFLNQAIVWSRPLSAQQQLVTEPSDALFLNDSRQAADQIVRLAFEFARARAQALASQQGTGGGSASQQSSSQYQRLIESANKADQQVKTLQQELDGFRQQLVTATGSRRTTLQAIISETEGELELFQARRDAVRNMLQFATGTAASGLGSGSLLAQVEELARTVPAASGGKETETNSPASNAATPAAAAAPERKETPTGILALATDFFTPRRKVRALDENLRQTDQLAETSKNLRAPLVAKMRELTQKGDELAAQPDSQDPVVLAQQRKDLDALTAQFKQVSASLLPLGKQSILLDVYKRTTTNWRNAVASEYRAEWKGLLLRLAVLAVILGVLPGGSELWRRGTFRYITDARRRYQFLP